MCLVDLEKILKGLFERHNLFAFINLQVQAKMFVGGISLQFFKNSDDLESGNIMTK